jgi:4'-phosphopantetheinyl transferase
VEDGKRYSMTGITVYPVAISVSPAGRQLTLRSAVRHLSGLARLAACMSAQRANLPCPAFRKNEQGAPLPDGGNWWSLSHKKGMVAGVTAPVQIGIDIEKIRPAKEGLFARTAAPQEWALLTGNSEEIFFRAWTAKEAVLKAAGSGIGDLLTCRILSPVEARQLRLRYRGRDWIVQQTLFEGYVAACAALSPVKVRWQVLTGT